MDAQRWFLLVVLIVLVAIVAYRQMAQTRDRREQDRRIDAQALGRASSPSADISEREDRRLAGMSDEDRAWEQASLQRQRDAQERTRLADTAGSREAAP